MPSPKVRTRDAVFDRAVECLDAGDADGLRDHLRHHPNVVHQRVAFESSYFQEPTLLEFVAGNPTRHDHLPPNIVEVARVILDAGAGLDQRSVDSTLALVCSGRVPRECGVQVPLIDLLCDAGANAHEAMLPALVHGEFAAVDALIRRGGADVTLVVAAATGRFDEARRALSAANSEDRHRALALAAQHGHEEIVRLLLDAGEDANRYNPTGCHAHSTPLHQAAYAGHEAVVRLLVERGARFDIRDGQWHATAIEWAEHGSFLSVAEYLRGEGHDDSRQAAE